MRRIVDYHKEHCKNSDYGDAIIKTGGSVGPYGDQASVRKKNDCDVLSPTSVTEVSADQRANFNPEAKCTEISGPTQVNINQSPPENNTKQSNEQILSAVWKKYYTICFFIFYIHHINHISHTYTKKNLYTTFQSIQFIVK